MSSVVIERLADHPDAFQRLTAPRSMPYDPATLIGSFGVALLLVAFLLNLFKLLRADGRPYMGLNLIGAALACYSSYLIHFMPFVILEGVWTIAALVAIVRASLGTVRPS